MKCAAAHITTITIIIAIMTIARGGGRITPGYTPDFRDSPLARFVFLFTPRSGRVCAS